MDVIHNRRTNLLTQIMINQHVTPRGVLKWSSELDFWSQLNIWRRVFVSDRPSKKKRQKSAKKI